MYPPKKCGSIQESYHLLVIYVTMKQGKKKPVDMVLKEKGFHVDTEVSVYTWFLKKKHLHMH